VPYNWFDTIRLLLTSTLLLIAACSGDDPYKDRLSALESDKDTLKIALAWPYDGEKGGTKVTVKQGVELAIDEVNNNGGILGRDLVLELYNDQRDVNVGLRNAQLISQNESLFAVIGHLDSYISIPTTPTYTSSGLIVLNPGSTDSALTLQGDEHLFRILSTNEVQGQQLAQHLERIGKRRVMIFYVNNSYGLALANSFENQVVKQGMVVVDRRAYDKFSRDHGRTMADWKSFYDFDSIFFAGSMPEGIEIVREIREAGIDVDIYAGAGLDSLEFVEQGGGEVSGTKVISFFHPGVAKPSIKTFVEGYKAAYGIDPVEASAALGYDAVKLLAVATNKAGSLDRTKVAIEMRAMEGWEGATGHYSFDENGDVVGKMLVLTEVNDGQFQSPIIIQ
jgi:branched-chain amino acid transport system substrate-binding protein